MMAVVCLLCVVLAFSLSGCWDARDIDHIGFVMGMGVDESDDGQTTVWVQMALPSPSLEKAGEFPGWMGSATGSTIMEAMSVLNTKSAKTLFRGHVRVLVIGERIARKGPKADPGFFSQGLSIPLQLVGSGDIRPCQQGL